MREFPRDPVVVMSRKVELGRDRLVSVSAAGRFYTTGPRIVFAAS